MATKEPTRWQDQPINNVDNSVKITFELTYSQAYYQHEELKVGDHLNGGLITAIKDKHNG